MNTGREETQQNKKRPPWFRKWLRILAWASALLALTLILITAFFEDKVMSRVGKEMNTIFLHPVEYSDSGMSFFRSFPAITFSFENMKIKGSDPNVADPAVEIPSLHISFDWVKLLVTGKIEVDRIRMNTPVIRIHVDKEGNPNYNFLKKGNNGLEKLLNKLTEEGKVLNLKGISMHAAEMYLKDYARNLDLYIAGWNLKASGAFEAGDIRLETDSRMKEVDMTLKGYKYLNNKVLESQHITIIRPNALSVFFERNDMNINKLNFDFQGQLDFLERGLRVDLLLESAPGELSDIISALPERFVKWHRVKELNLSGDAVTTIQLKGLSEAATGIRPDLKVNLSWKDGTLLPKGVKTSMRDIYVDLEAIVPGLDLNHMRVDLDTINFTNGDKFLKGHFNLERNEHKLIMDGNLSARLDLENLTHSLGLDSIAFKGDLTSDLQIHGTYDTVNRVYPAMNGFLKVRDGNLNTAYYPAPLENIQLDMDLSHDGVHPEKGTMKINEARFDFEGERFSADALVEDFTDPLFTVRCKGVLRPGKLNRVFGREDIDVDGVVKMDVMLKTRMSLVRNYEFNKMVSSGGFDMENMTLKSPYLKAPVKLEAGAFRFSKGSIKFEKFLGSYARSNFSINGELRSFLKHLFYDDEKVQGRFTVEADRVFLDDFLLKSGELTARASQGQNEVIPADKPDGLQEGVLQIPGFIDITCDYKFGELVLENLKIQDFEGLAAIVQGGMFIKEGRLNMIGTSLQLDGVYKSFGPEKSYFEYDIEVSEFDIERAYQEVEMFRNLAPGAKNASGVVGLDYQLSGVLNEDMKVLLPSLEGGGLMTLRDVRVKNNDILAEVSKSTGNKELLDAELKEIGIRTHIDNGIIDVEEFNFRVKPFRLRMQGQTTLDRQINMKMRLGLPPGGILGIPIKITGTPPNLQIRLGKKTKDLDEAFYDEDGLTELQMAKFSAFSDSLTADMSIGELQKMKERILNAPSGEFRPSGATSDGVKIKENQ
ncbi:AsmA family protein [Robertkochia flava]|uniref:AsmA-like C-terminal region-containing protein n=1 Tax=Robertkochia flava TaxID=3447986 RepID=UPI001CCB7F25|nr:AsmA-like C-terminal region-containing protein [Robertkochia marina]